MRKTFKASSLAFKHEAIIRDDHMDSFLKNLIIYRKCIL